MPEHETIPDQHRVVVTGIGAITPIGIGVEGLRSGLRAARSAVRTITAFDPSPFSSHVAATVEGFDPLPYIEGKKLKRLDKFSQFAVAAAKMSIADARLDLDETDRDRVAVCLGTALGGISFAEEQYPKFMAQGPRGVNPMLALSVFNGAGSCNVAIELGLNGPATANGDSCAAAPIAIGRAFDLIRARTVDVALAGGCEAPLSPLCFGAFALIRAMSQRNDDPETASRPFDSGRDGFVMAEGAAMLTLESLVHAKARGGTIYGEILGHACTNDGYHMTHPRADNAQTARCMRLCLDAAGVQPEQVGYINAHGSSTPLNDSAETAAIKQVFGDATHQIPVSGTKGAHGHALGASGAWEAAISLLAIRDDWLPPTLNLENPDPACDLDYIRECQGRAAHADYVLSNSFGFGGINACLLFGRV
ncbi:MAG TPA: beta-ketoacyl-[acyl-carrier-protein] synthase family protein [Chthonomonadaceae bacterium]|nr:beta-ketoacyl-[acyl-carrier-protein] synthase family protein [Chthonomonadaceae bacterium]